MGQNTENEADLDITLIRAQTIATSTSFPATVEVPVDDLSAVVIPATKALRAVLEELGGSGPTYEHVSSREFKVHFQIMLKGHSFGIVVPVKFVDDILAEEGWEHCARIALRYLRDDDDIGIHAVDYNWSTAEEIRKRCSVLLGTLIESEEIYDFIKSKSYVVADGIKLAADIFESKGFEMANEMFADPPPPFEDFQFYAVMTGEYRYCVEELWSTRNRCYCYMERQHSLYQLLRDLKRSAFRLKMKTYESMPYANYVKVNNKETATIVSSVIKMILEEVASKAGFQIPVLRIDHVSSSGHRASVQLTTASEIAEASNAVTHFIQGKVASDKHEAANSAMYAAVHLLVHKYGVEIIDPSTYMLRDLKHLERAIQAEIQLIPESLDWFHKIARDALHETYELADRYNGSICEMDAKINGLLISMCYDLAQHTDAFYEKLLRKAIENSRRAETNTTQYNKGKLHICTRFELQLHFSSVPIFLSLVTAAEHKWMGPAWGARLAVGGRSTGGRERSVDDVGRGPQVASRAELGRSAIGTGGARRWRTGLCSFGLQSGRGD